MSNAEFEAATEDASLRLDRLKARYEQWFQGVERVPPVRFREQLERTLRELRRRTPNNTMLRFKFQTLYQRWTTMSHYWDRVTRQIEEGTYRRDVLKAKRRRDQREKAQAQAQSQASADDASGMDAPSPAPVLELDLDMDMDLEVSAALDAITAHAEAPPPPPPPPKSGPAVFGKPRPKQRPSRPPRPTAASESRPISVVPPMPPPPPPRRPPIAPDAARAAAQMAPPTPVSRGTIGRVPLQKKRVPAPAASRDPSLSKTEMRAVYDRYVAARKKNNERVDNVKFEKLAASIQKMVPKLEKKHGGKKIDFEVVVKNGRVGLKPVAK